MKPKTNKFKPFYTVTDFAEILQMSRVGARKMLQRLNIPYTYIGRKVIYYISDLRDHSPTLFSSILEASQLNKILFRSNQDVDLTETDSISDESHIPACFR